MRYVGDNYVRRIIRDRRFVYLCRLCLGASRSPQAAPHPGTPLWGKRGCSAEGAYSTILETKFACRGGARERSAPQFEQRQMRTPGGKCRFDFHRWGGRCFGKRVTCGGTETGRLRPRSAPGPRASVCSPVFPPFSRPHRSRRDERPPLNTRAASLVSRRSKTK